jgi:hypothetical protein
MSKTHHIKGRVEWFARLRNSGANAHRNTYEDAKIVADSWAGHVVAEFRAVQS